MKLQLAIVFNEAELAELAQDECAATRPDRKALEGVHSLRLCGVAHFRQESERSSDDCSYRRERVGDLLLPVWGTRTQQTELDRNGDRSSQLWEIT